MTPAAPPTQGADARALLPGKGKDGSVRRRLHPPLPARSIGGPLRPLAGRRVRRQDEAPPCNGARAEHAPSAAATTCPAPGTRRGRRAHAHAAHARAEGGAAAAACTALLRRPHGHTGNAGIPCAAAPPSARRLRNRAAGFGAAPGAEGAEGSSFSAKSRAGQADGGAGEGSTRAAERGAEQRGAGSRPGGGGETGAAGAGEAAPAGQPPAQQQPPAGRGARAEPRLEIKLAYIIKDSGYAAKGQVVGPKGFDEYMRRRVGARHADSAGARIIRGAFGRVGTSGFGSGILDGLLSPSPSERQPWRIGESLAECLLEDREGAVFPYPYSRDAKSESASHAGPDLVGYSLGDPGGARAMFLFGETKTSDEERRPPRVAGRLADQMNALCTRGAQKMLVKRLTFKAEEQGDPRLRELHLESVLSYRAGKFRLAGVLVRGLAADKRDLEAAFDKVKASRCAERLDLISLYLPVRAGRLGGML